MQASSFLDDRNRPLQRFLSAGIRAIHRGGGTALVLATLIAGSGSGVADPVGPAARPPAAASTRADDEVRLLARQMRARPGEVFRKLGIGMTLPRPDAYKTRHLAMTLGDLLRAQADAGGEPSRDELSELLSRGARQAVQSGLSLQIAVDVMTMLDPLGTAVPEAVRRALWLDLSRSNASRAPLAASEMAI
jgi:hypothetical protein